MPQSIRRKPTGVDIDYQVLRDSNSTLPTSPCDRDSDSSATLSLIQQSSDEDSTHISSKDEKDSTLTNQYASWGIHWQKPTFIIVILFVGLCLSLAHHSYYLSLNNKKTGDAEKQAWPTRIGTGLAFLVTSCFKAATTVAFSQYIWTIVKNQSFTMASLDKLFALSTDPTALLSLKLLKNAKIALLLGIVTWLLGLASVAPPATLTVVAKNISQEIHVPVLDFSLPIWNASEPALWDSTLVTNTIAINAATNMDVAQLARQVTGSEWSYPVQFFGPSLQCHEPNSTEQVIFNNVTQWFEKQNIFTFTDLNVSSKAYSIDSGRLIYTSWSSWFASGSPNEELTPYPFGFEASMYPQIWIQTSASSIVCNSVNASFEIMVSFVDGVQHISQQNIQVIGNYDISYAQVNTEEARPTENADGAQSISAVGGSELVLWSPYIPHMYAIGGVLSGNITLHNFFGDNEDDVQQYYGYGATNVLETGLMACDEIANSPFKSLGMGVMASNATETFTNTFPSEPWMCRNGTLMRAIEDLANNITISYLSSPDLTNDNNTHNVITSNTYNIYVYHPLYLLLSYGLALLFSSIAVIIGFYSMHLNGVFHSNSFSAIVAATRNLELGTVTGRSSLGADPMKTDAGDPLLRFGPLLSTTDELKNKVGSNVRMTGEVPHVAFGFEENIGQLRKGELYI